MFHGDDAPCDGTLTEMAVTSQRLVASSLVRISEIPLGPRSHAYPSSTHQQRQPSPHEETRKTGRREDRKTGRQEGGEIYRRPSSEANRAVLPRTRTRLGCQHVSLIFFLASRSFPSRPFPYIPTSTHNAGLQLQTPHRRTQQLPQLGRRIGLDQGVQEYRPEHARAAGTG